MTSAYIIIKRTEKQGEHSQSAGLSRLLPSFGVAVQRALHVRACVRRERRDSTLGSAMPGTSRSNGAHGRSCMGGIWAEKLKLWRSPAIVKGSARMVAAVG